MAITVSGTTITFNDGTTQTTAGGSVSTATVLAATAGATVGDVGTYAMLSRTSGSVGSTAPGVTLAGSSLVYSGGLSVYTGGARNMNSTTVPAGTWRAMGFQYAINACCSIAVTATLWLRIS